MSKSGGRRDVAPLFRRSDRRASRPYSDVHTARPCLRRRGGWRAPTIVGEFKNPPRLPPDVIHAQRCLWTPNGNGVRGSRRAAGAMWRRCFDVHRSAPAAPTAVAITATNARVEYDERVGRRGAAAEPLPRRRSRRPPSRDARPSTDTRPDVSTRESTQPPPNKVAARDHTNSANQPRGTIPPAADRRRGRPNTTARRAGGGGGAAVAPWRSRRPRRTTRVLRGARAVRRV